MPGKSIGIPATDGNGSFSTYLAGPADEQAPASVLLHEIYGVTGWVTKPPTCLPRAATG